MASRDDLRALAAENHEIFDLGLYEAPDGTVVDIEDALIAMMAQTRVIDMSAETTDGRYPGQTRISLASETTVAGIDRLSVEGEFSVCVLNFASARSPGGGYLRGGNAQEEALCRATTLYPALAAQAAYYHLNKGWPTAIYSDALIYSPNVLLIRDEHGTLRPDPVPMAVITAPAPNVRALAETGLSEKLGSDVAASLALRVERILATACAYGHDSVVLGAWGCGVFGNPPDLVAGLFSDALSGPFEGCFKRVHFAVPGRDGDPNQTVFTARFGPPLPS